MQIGRLDRQITIQENTPTRSGTGAEKESWGTIGTDGTPRANVRSVAGGETFRGAQIVAEATKVFLVRHRTDLTTKMRISYESEAYDIHKIDELGRGEGLIIQASAVEV